MVPCGSIHRTPSAANVAIVDAITFELGSAAEMVSTGPARNADLAASNGRLWNAASTRANSLPNGAMRLCRVDLHAIAEAGRVQLCLDRQPDEY